MDLLQPRNDVFFLLSFGTVLPLCLQKMDDITEFGWFSPGLESLAPGLKASGVVYGIYCNKTDTSWVKIGSVNIERVRDNLRRDIYAGQTKYLFVLDVAMHVAAEDTIHRSLAAHAHPKHSDCFSLTPCDLMQRCIQIVQPLNLRTIQTTAEPLIGQLREQHRQDLAAFEQRERVFLAQLECFTPLLNKLMEEHLKQ